MRIGLVSLLVLAGCITATAALADGGGDQGSSGTVIYRSTDANGNTVFSDQPPANGPAQTVKLGPTNAVPMATPAPTRPQGGKRGFPGYSSLVITSPDDGATIRNPDKPITVQAKVTPPLQPGDRLRLVDNGQTLNGMSLDNPNRGTHTLQVEVVGKEGSVRIQSPSITVYIHRTSVAQQHRNHSGSAATAVSSFGNAASTGSAAAAGGAASAGSGASPGSAATLGRAARPSSPPPQ